MKGWEACLGAYFWGLVSGLAVGDGWRLVWFGWFESCALFCGCLSRLYLIVVYSLGLPGVSVVGPVLRLGWLGSGFVGDRSGLGLVPMEDSLGGVVIWFCVV